MSTSIPCPGCARVIAVADGDPRKQIRCPACGFTVERALAPPGAITATPPRRESVVRCTACGEPLWSASNRDKRPTHCPQCGSPAPRPARKQKTPAKPASEQITAAGPHMAVAPPSPFTAPAVEDDEAYQFATPIRKCPSCQRELTDDAVLCVACGYNCATGSQAVREYAPVERSWEGILSYRRRLQLFCAAHFLWVFVFPGAMLGGLFIETLCVWLISNAMLAFLLGTFHRVDVARSEIGHVKLTKTWRVCFVPRAPIRINLAEYTGVATGKARDADLWDWVVLVTLLGYGLIPGCLWWYFAFQRDLFYVGLVRDHGSLAVELYRGWDEAMTREIAQVIRDVGGYQ